MTELTTPYDVAVVPTQAALGICLDCDRTQPTTKNGKCSVCGSNSIIRKGAITELRKQLRARARREARRNRKPMKGASSAKHQGKDTPSDV